MHRDDLPIPSPCHADWSAMEARDKARFCAECSLEVIDVSAYREAEARALIQAPRTGRVCMSYVVRKSGEIRFADTPDVPVRSLMRTGRSVVAAAALALAACGGRSGGQDARLVGDVQPLPTARSTGGHETPTSAPDAGATVGDETVIPPCETREQGQVRRQPDPVGPDEMRTMGEPLAMPE